MAQHRGFNDDFYHDEHLIDSWNSVVHKKDLTFILGDVTMETHEHYYKLDRLVGRKVVVMGNHDLHQHTRELLKYVETVAGMIDYKGFCLTHAPIHPNEISFYRGNIHAHIHENKLHELYVVERYGDDSFDLETDRKATVDKYYNVDALKIGFKPKTIEQLLGI